MRGLNRRAACPAAPAPATSPLLGSDHLAHPVGHLISCGNHTNTRQCGLYSPSPSAMPPRATRRPLVDAVARLDRIARVSTKPHGPSLDLGFVFDVRHLIDKYSGTFRRTPKNAGQPLLGFPILKGLPHGERGCGPGYQPGPPPLTNTAPVDDAEAARVESATTVLHPDGDRGRPGARRVAMVNSSRTAPSRPTRSSSYQGGSDRHERALLVEPTWN